MKGYEMDLNSNKQQTNAGALCSIDINGLIRQTKSNERIILEYAVLHEIYTVLTVDTDKLKQYLVDTGLINE